VPRRCHSSSDLPPTRVDLTRSTYGKVRWRLSNPRPMLKEPVPAADHTQLKALPRVDSAPLETCGLYRQTPPLAGHAKKSRCRDVGAEAWRTTTGRAARWIPWHPVASGCPQPVHLRSEISPSHTVPSSFRLLPSSLPVSTPPSSTPPPFPLRSPLTTPPKPGPGFVHRRLLHPKAACVRLLLPRRIIPIFV
jgi:hypothetical protein